MKRKLLAELGDSAVVVGRFNPCSRIRPGDSAKVAVLAERLNFFDTGTRLAIWD